MTPLEFAKTAAMSYDRTYVLFVSGGDMSRRKSARSIVSDTLGGLPLPQALLAYPQDWANGRSHTFLVERSCPYSGQEIENLLTTHGIRVWGKMIVFGEIMLTVRRAQAKWAQYLLEREGVPIQHGTEFCKSSSFKLGSRGDLWESLLYACEALLDSWGL
jgi:hypothetical protein